jgi:UDP:flavonoid glycosyltransferase YjiC (YdhE family)
MRALLTSIGSPGDINPFIAIGRALQQRGYRATLLVNPLYGPQVTAAGLDFLPLGTEAQLLRIKSRPFMRQPRSGARHIWREVVLPAVPQLVAALEALVQRDPPDVMVCHPAALGTRWVCQRHGIPYAVAALSPTAWLSSQDRSVYGRAFLRDSPPAWLGSTFVRLAKPFFRWTVDRRLNPIRQRFGFARARNLFLDHVLGGDRSLGMWSTFFRPPMPDDPSNAYICGFPWSDRGHQAPPAENEIARFLEEGEPPIVFTMGTTVVTAAGSFYEQAAEACHRLGRRGLLLTGAPENAPRRLPAGVRAFTYAPFSRVLPRGCATVHHGGIGTTAQALRSGKPTVVIPIAWDQFDNAARVRRLGVSLTLQRREVAPATLARRLRRVLESPAVITRAARLGERLAREDGAAVAADLLEQLVGAPAAGARIAADGAASPRHPIATSAGR